MLIQSLKIEKTTAGVDPYSAQYKTAAYCCPFCDVLINAEMDPIAVRAELLEQIKRMLGR
jgi:hypothetical protein